MVKYFYFSLLLLISVNSIAQDSIPLIKGDSIYREDQFYIGVSYNVFSSIPEGVSSKGISGGITLGYLRDMPINKRRSLAVAVGLGFSYDQFGQNILIEEDDQNNTIYTILPSETDFKYNRLSVFVIEAPIELRWRSSTPTEYKFWRVYAGFRLGYTMWNKSSFKSSSLKITNSNINEFDKLRLATFLSLGYSKFNLFVQYNINPFFNNDAITEDGQQVDFNGIKLGLIFYLL